MRDYRIMDLTAAEIRVAACLVEKQRTTPDAYPLSLNSLRLACNQTTSRDPVVHFDDATLREALERLHRRGWTRLASSSGSRTMKYRHLMGEALSVEPPELSLLAVLMLRGPQTAVELHTRVERLYGFAEVGDVEAALEGLAGRGLGELLPRQTGQRGQRWRHLLGEAPEEAEQPGPQERPPTLEQRVSDLEREVAAMRRELGS